MATKTNIRSIRFSDDIAELIDRQVGDTFTQKFENLVTRCVWELPETERRLQRTEEMIRQERERYQILHRECSNYSYMLQSIGEKLIEIQRQLDELIEEA